MSAEHRPRQIRLMVPDGWHAVDLTDRAATRSSLAALVASQVGETAELEDLRTELLGELERSATGAAASGAVLMAFSTMRSGSTPIPASMTVYRVPGLRLDPEGVATLREAVGPGEDWRDGRTPRGRVVRRTRIVTGDPALGAGTTGQLLADYWVTGTDDQGAEPGVLSIVFATPMLQLRDVMLELFDAVVASLELTETD